MPFRALPLIVLCLLFAACSGAPNGQDTQPTSTPIPTLAALAPTTYTVQRGDVQDNLDFQGRWLPRDQNALAFQTGGTVRRVLVQRGDAVTAGELLADLDLTSQENSLQSAELTLQQAQQGLSGDSTTNSVADAEVQLANANLSLENARDSSPWQQTQSAKLGVETAQRNLAEAQRRYDDLVSRPDSPAATVDQAYQGVLAAQEQVRSAQLTYQAAGQSWAQYQIQVKQAENGIASAQLALDRARSGADNPDALDAVRSAQLQVDQIKAAIANGSLYAPNDGVVLEINIQPGDSAQAYKTVITIGRPEPKEAIATLNYSDTQRLQPQQVGVCNVFNQPDTAVQCIIRRLPLSAQDADQTVRVAATLPNVPEGTLIDITMPLDVRHDVLWLPPDAIRTFQNKTFVVIQTPDGQRRADIEIGLQTTDRVEITSGVNQGDVVVAP